MGGHTQNEEKTSLKTKDVRKSRGRVFWCSFFIIFDPKFPPVQRKHEWPSAHLQICVQTFPFSMRFYRTSFLLYAGSVSAHSSSSSVSAWQTLRSRVAVGSSYVFWKYFFLLFSPSLFFPSWLGTTEASFCSLLEADMWKREEKGKFEKDRQQRQAGGGGGMNGLIHKHSEPETHRGNQFCTWGSITLNNHWPVYEPIVAQLSCKLCSYREDLIWNP